MAARPFKTELAERIAVARGSRPADLVIRGGTLVNVFSGELLRTDVAVHGGVIAGLGEYRGKRTVDVTGKYVLPGFIDSHVHLESTMLVPAQFARAVLPHGTTAVVADPHEIANVLGIPGILSLLSASEGLPLDVYVMLPSCVPASDLVTSGARLLAKDLRPLLKHPRVLGLAEMMDYAGVLAARPAVLQKLDLFSEAVIDGHAPGLSGHDLAAYAAAGITSDHECITADEAREKVRMGMTVFIREGSSAKNLEALLPAVTPGSAGSFCLCTDDLDPDDLLEGSMDRIMSKAVRLGIDPVIAVQMATINPARHFGLRRKGAVLPGYQADLVVVDDLKAFGVEMVFKNGRLVSQAGKMVTMLPRSRMPSRNTVRIRRLRARDLLVKARTDRALIMGLIPGQIETSRIVSDVNARDGSLQSDTRRDILKLVVVERHRRSGNIGLGLVQGFGLRTGALASTVAHDSHNIIAVGALDSDIVAAVEAIRKMNGGLVVVNKGKVLASLPLPIAGLMSDRPAEDVAKRLREVEKAARSLGVLIEHPFGTLGFLALPVVPELKLTDRGLVDVSKASFVDLFV